MSAFKNFNKKLICLLTFMAVMSVMLIISHQMSSDANVKFQIPQEELRIKEEMKELISREEADPMQNRKPPDNHLAEEKALPKTEAEVTEAETTVLVEIDKAFYPPVVVNTSIPALSDSKSKGPGEGGKAFEVDREKMSAAEKAEYDLGRKNNAFNQFISDRISVRRYIPDSRMDQCKTQPINPKLKKASIIICFHNEAWSTLIRSIHSIIDRSDPNLIEEILLVDDASDMEHLKEQLEKYIEPLGVVKIHRIKERVGLIQARLAGVALIKAEIALFLDSHIECFPGWLEPLLSAIADDRRNVVAPVIANIIDETFELRSIHPQDVQVGGFRWSLTFSWHYPPEEIRKRKGAPYTPLPTPTIAGGLFAIDKSFFEELGYYDPGFEVWGAENLEISFKTWMCHGSLYVIPCSVVGHIFRSRSPYKWDSKHSRPLKRNNDRLAEVWLDDYKKFYYERTGKRLDDIGDISDRVAIRKERNCNSFKWYLDNIYPDLFNPEDALLHGRIRNEKTNMCIDSGVKNKIFPFTCHTDGGPQAWYLTRLGEIRQEENCFDVNSNPGYLGIYSCHGLEGFQKFTYNETGQRAGSVIESVRGCVELNGEKLEIKPCNPDNEMQKWFFEEIPTT